MNNAEIVMAVVAVVGMLGQWAIGQKAAGKFEGAVGARLTGVEADLERHQETLEDHERRISRGEGAAKARSTHA